MFCLGWIFFWGDGLSFIYLFSLLVDLVFLGHRSWLSPSRPFPSYPSLPTSFSSSSSPTCSSSSSSSSSSELPYVFHYFSTKPWLLHRSDHPNWLALETL